MGKMIRFEFDKLFRQRSFYICIIVAVVMIILSAASLKLIEKLTEDMTNDSPTVYENVEETGEPDEDGITVEYDVSNDYTINYTGWNLTGKAVTMSSFSIIICVFISIFVCSEFEEGTIKNIISRGYGRYKIYISKYISSMVGVCVIFAAVHISMFIVASILWKPGNMDRNLEMILYYLAAYLAYATIYFFLAMVFAKFGLSITIGIVGPTFVNITVSVLNMLLKLDNPKISDFWIDGFMSDIANIGYFESPDSTRLTVILIGSIIYLVVFFLMGMLVNRKREV